MVLYTFGRDLKWNPHIHCLISEGGYSDDAYWCNVKHFNYSFFLELYYRYKRVSLEKKYFPVPDGFQIRFQDHSTAVVADYFQLFPCSYFHVISMFSSPSCDSVWFCLHLQAISDILFLKGR